MSKETTSKLQPVEMERPWTKALEDPEFMEQWPNAIEQKPRKKMPVSRKQQRGVTGNG